MIRGHLVVLPVKGDLMFIETIWVNSTQNEMPQLKLFAIRYHGRITSGTTLRDAVQKQPTVLLAGPCPGEETRHGDLSHCDAP